MRDWISQKAKTQNYLLRVMIVGSPVPGLCAETRNRPPITITQNR